MVKHPHYVQQSLTSFEYQNGSWKIKPAPTTFWNVSVPLFAPNRNSLKRRYSTSKKRLLRLNLKNHRPPMENSQPLLKKNTTLTLHRILQTLNEETQTLCKTFPKRRHSTAGTSFTNNRDLQIGTTNHNKKPWKVQERTNHWFMKYTGSFHATMRQRRHSVYAGMRKLPVIEPMGQNER